MTGVSGETAARTTAGQFSVKLLPILTSAAGRCFRFTAAVPHAIPCSPAESPKAHSGAFIFTVAYLH
jgi:hypothetical protein